MGGMGARASQHVSSERVPSHLGLYGRSRSIVRIVHPWVPPYIVSILLQYDQFYSAVGGCQVFYSIVSNQAKQGKEEDRSIP